MLNLSDAYKIFLIVVGALTPVLGYVIRTEIALYRLRKGTEELSKALSAQVDTCNLKSKHAGQLDEQWKKAMENTLERICVEQEKTKKSTEKSMRNFETLLTRLDKTVDRLTYIVEQHAK
jgi:tellurite resistance protein